MSFKIGDVEIKNRVVLAPMAGISNPSYIKLLEEFGVGLVFTELISAEAISRNNKKTLDMLNGLDDICVPVGVQIFGNNKDSMSRASKYLCDNYKCISFIDINMGCPVPKVALRSGAGSALLKDKNLVFDIVSSVVESSSVPVTVKIRSGWDSSSINAVEIARIIEAAGASCITVHPRTRSQGYSGVADWSIIRDVKASVSIPVIGNGDIKSCYDAKRMMDETLCDAVMIGRACIGNPWIIKDSIEFILDGVVPSEVSVSERVRVMKKHLSYLCLYKPARVAALEFRMHVCKYLKGLKGCTEVNSKIQKTVDIDEIFEILDSFLEEADNV